jgi:hypothetical protein
MDFLVPENHTFHIAFLSRLLGIHKKCNIIDTHYNISLNTIPDYTDYYNNLIKQVPSAKNYIKDINFFLRNYTIFKQRIAINEYILLNKTKNIKETEIEFIKFIERKGLIPIGSHLFGKNPENTKAFIKWSIEHMYKRIPSNHEICFHATECIHKTDTIVSWLMLLFTCEEGMTFKYNEFFSEYTEKNKRVAVVFCGYVRNYEKVCASHLKLIEQPNVDIFIHTWSDIGLKSNNLQSQWLNNDSPDIDIDKLKSLYKPVKIKIENNKDILPNLSLINKISPIFAYNGQAKDDCSKYINSQLYSIHEAYKLIEEYENEKGFKYDGIIKLRFDFQVKYFSYNGILSDIDTDAVWFAHCHLNHHGHSGGGGGCKICDSEDGNLKKHTKHSNDICDIWFYGKRDVVKEAFELYLHGLEIMQKNHNQNLDKYKNVSHSIDKEFIYIHNTNDIERNIVCFYPERLLREHLNSFHCKSSINIQGYLCT